MDYEWDDKKDEANRKKHGISFESAKTVFSDRSAITEVDAGHSKSEPRQKIVGCSLDGRIISVVFTKRGSIIRIISAQERRKDRKIYENKN